MHLLSRRDGTDAGEDEETEEEEEEAEEEEEEAEEADQAGLIDALGAWRWEPREPEWGEPAESRWD